MRQKSLKVQLARLLEVDEKEILEPRHGTKLLTMESVLGVLGKRIELQLI